MCDQLEWRETPGGRGDVPVSTRFDDPYYSLDNGLAETRHVFLDGNDLPRRISGDFHVAELGFGTGLNFLTLKAATDRAFHFTSFEGFPLSEADARRALAPFDEVRSGAEALLNRWADVMAGHRVALGNVTLQIHVGPVSDTLPAFEGPVDAWFLDGFSPERNPEMWAEDVLARVGHTTRAGGTFATYTAAGHVRRALDAAGFDVERIPGFGRKRHMTRGTR